MFLGKRVKPENVVQNKTHNTQMTPISSHVNNLSGSVWMMEIERWRREMREEIDVGREEKRVYKVPE